MSFTVRFTEQAEEDLVRLYERFAIREKTTITEFVSW